jgi:hypothetical protein
MPNRIGPQLGNKRNPEGASTNLHPLGALTSHQVEPEGPTQVGLRHCSEDLCRRPSSPRDSLNPKAVGCLSDGSTTRRSPAGSILSDPAGETAVLLLRVDPHARSEVSLRPCGACRFPSKHKRNVDHSKTLVFDFGSPNFASRWLLFARVTWFEICSRWARPAREINPRAREIEDDSELDAGGLSRIRSHRLIGGDPGQAPESRETLRLARRRPGLRVRSLNGG